MKSASLTFENVKGTAFDSSFDGEYLVVAGQLGLTVVSIGLPSTSWLKVKTNRNVVKQVKFHPNARLNLFASISGQVVDIYELCRSSLLQRITSFTAHSRRISDFCWSSLDDNLLVCCADQDTISFWDLRETQKPCFELKLIFGASQAKFAPHNPDVLMTSHGCDLRLWDIRNMRSSVYPVNQFTATESRINSLQWHPSDANIFATSEINGQIKLWDISDRDKSLPKLVSESPAIHAWRFMFSPEGDELASISLPAKDSNCVNIFSNLALENPQPLNAIDDGDVVLDICWQKQVYKSTKYLFTLHKSNKLCRHPVAYELSNETRDEMATPIAQSAVDEERDRLIAEHAEDTNLDDSTVFTHYEKDTLSTPISMVIGAVTHSATSSHFNPKSQHAVDGCFSTTSSKSAALSADSFSRLTAHSLRGALNNLGTATTSSQSPIASEWYRWITAPNKTGGDLYFELESLGNRKHTTEGLYTTEVNFQRAAIGFSYMHWNTCRKIMFEMRFHKSFIENGLVFVEVIQKDSPLSPDKATLFLTLLQQESDEQAKVVSEQTILSRVFQHLPEIVESMKIFTASMPISSANESVSMHKTANSSLSGSCNEEQRANEGESSDCFVSTSLKPNAVIPVTYTPSPYDHFVPAPRNCGARFNGSGCLVTFGRVNYSNFSKIPRIKGTIASVIGDAASYQQTENSVSSRHKSVQKTGRGAEDAENVESLYDFNAFPSSSAEIPRVLAATVSVSKRSGKRHTQKSNTTFTSLGRTSGTLDFVRPVNPRSLADYCVLVAAPHQINAAGSSSVGRQKPAVVNNEEGVNKFCSVNSTSPTTLFSSSATSSSNNTVIAAPSTHPPSVVSLAGSASGIHVTDSTPVACVTANVINQSLIQRNNSVKSITKVLGSSPSAVAMVGSSSARTYSLQNVNNRHRGNSITASTAVAMELTEHAAVMPEPSFSSTVLAYDVSGLLPVSKELAGQYKLLGGSALELCRHNLQQVAKSPRKDLVKLWKLLEQCVSASHNNKRRSKIKNNGKNHSQNTDNFDGEKKPSNVYNTPWSFHPFGRELINSLLDHYGKLFDIQTAAVITCVLGERRSTAYKLRQQQLLSSSSLSTGLLFRKGMEVFGGGTTIANCMIFAMPSRNIASQQAIISSTKNSANDKSINSKAAETNFGVQATSKLTRSSSFVNEPLVFSVEEIEVQRYPTARKPSSSVIANPRLNIVGAISKVDSLSILAPADCSMASESSMEKHTDTSQRASLGLEEETGENQWQEQRSELFLDPCLAHRFEDIRMQYADLLFRWGMFLKCTEVRKYCYAEEDEASHINAISWCDKCRQILKHTDKCSNCKRAPIYCAVCEEPCYGTITTCKSCSHGGHLSHIASWFRDHSSCPLFCGCECKI